MSTTVFSSRRALPARLFARRCHLAKRRFLFNFPSPFGNSGDSLQTYDVSRRINASALDMYDIVSNVSKYSEFVPFVEKSVVHEVDENTKQPSLAELRVGWKEFDESFVCKLHCVPSKSVLAESVTLSLFKDLSTEWTFTEMGSSNTPSCKVDLTLSYSFKNPVYNAISSMFSDQVTSIMIRAFENRAKQLKKTKS